MVDVEDSLIDNMHHNYNCTPRPQNKVMKLSTWVKAILWVQKKLTTIQGWRKGNHHNYNFSCMVEYVTPIKVQGGKRKTIASI